MTLDSGKIPYSWEMADRRKGSPDLFLRKPVGSACVRCCRGGVWQARDPGVGSGHRHIACLPWRCLSPPLESPLLCPTCHFGHDGSTERKSPSPQVARLALRCCPGQRAGGAFPSHCGGERFSEWGIVRGTGGSLVVKRTSSLPRSPPRAKNCEPNVPVCVYTHTHAYARTHALAHTHACACAHGGKEGPRTGRTQSRETWWSEKEGLGCNLWHHLSF